MGLLMFKNTGGVSEVSSDASYSNPILWNETQDGGTTETRYFMTMEAGEYATDGVVYAEDSLDDGRESWFEFAEDGSGGPGTYASTLNFEIDEDEEVSFWIKVVMPTGQAIGVNDDIQIKASYIRHQV